MGNSVTLLLIGGLISLVSTLAGIALQHWFDLLKRDRETRQHPTQIVYSKQTEFYDKVVELIPEINGYVTAIDVWLGETGPGVTERATECSKQTQPIWKLHELLERYYVYLPEPILRKGNEIFTECTFLSSAPTMERTTQCVELLFSFQNTLRRCVGVDAISNDLLKAFGTTEKPKKKTTESRAAW